ncbi:MAG TPA: monovalent cation/H(+) antiporter subunit G [Burkholderiaceae bacterium]|nr:monovalent cation/H(+) antiporter subunit G [Burkholderiaceae bacterium]
MTPFEVPLWAALPAALLLVLGSLLALVGSAGLLRLPNFQARMHAPTMGNTLGLGCILVASMLVASGHGQRVVVQEILIVVFVVLTSPVTALLLMQASLYREKVERRDADRN